MQKLIDRKNRPHFQAFLEEWEKNLVDTQQADEVDEAEERPKVVLTASSDGHLGATEEY